MSPATKSPGVIKQFRDFSGGLARTAARTAIKDTQVYWNENVQPIGAGQGQILAPAGPTIATIAAGISTMFPLPIKTSGVERGFIATVNTDGSMSQVNPANGTVTMMCPAGTVTTSARPQPWQDTPYLIIDKTKGYFTWDGTTFTTLSTTTTGTDLAVFEGRVWITTATRTVTFTSPGSFSDFTVNLGSGTAAIQDSVFSGSITRLLSALELLWIAGPAAINAISNVQVSGSGPAVTTFSNTNIVANVGSVLPSSFASFFRTFLFLSPYGVYAIVGATPQKLSDDLDGLFPSLVLGADAPAAVFTVNQVFVWAVLVTYKDPVTGNRPVLLCFARNAWFVASQGNALTWITSVVDPATGQPNLYGTDGSTIFQCFAGTAAGPYKWQSKLWDFGAFTQRKQLLYLSAELNSPQGNAITVSVTAENESGSAPVPTSLTPQNTITWTGAGGAAITFVGAGPITWVTSGLQQLRGQVDFAGDYLGLTISGTSLPFSIDAVSLEFDWMGERTG